MNQYLVDTKYAVEHLLAILYQEHNRLGKALKSQKMMKDAEKNTFENMKETGFTSEGIFDLVGFAYASERFESGATEIASMLSTIGTSLSIIAGSVLQIAKQGISITYDELAKCPDGRMVGRESLKNIIWQGRNQAMHFEEGNYNENVVKCFRNLELGYGSIFQLSNKNLAFEVLSVLEWKTYEKYENDLKKLLL